MATGAPLTSPGPIGSYSRLPRSRPRSTLFPLDWTRGVVVLLVSLYRYLKLLESWYSVINVILTALSCAIFDIKEMLKEYWHVVFTMLSMKISNVVFTTSRLKTVTVLFSVKMSALVVWIWCWRAHVMCWSYWSVMSVVLTTVSISRFYFFLLLKAAMC